MDADTERALAARPRFEGESAEECQECGDPIPQARREALPGTTQCVDCAAIAERQA
ncbi:MAG: TraR/DksA C4-type zinc finger protein [Salinirussus sp.]